jgi:hypothetical protein
MGHLRLGKLPKTRTWRQIVQEISPGGEMDTESLMLKTIEATKKSLQFYADSNRLSDFFHFVVGLSLAGRTGNLNPELLDRGIASVGQAENVFHLLRALKAREFESDNPERAAILHAAAGETISRWLATHQEAQDSLFEADSRPMHAWSQIANGAGFCEFTRQFFSTLLERHLRYYLDRAASSQLLEPDDIDRFRSNLSNRVDHISKLAFESSKITQSFAAGWYNRNANDSYPTQADVHRLANHSLDKLQEELRREVESR